MENKKIVIIYATNSGSTFVVARKIKKQLEKDFDVELIKASDAHLHKIENETIVLFGSPSWSFGVAEGYPHETMLELMEDWKKNGMKGKVFAIFGCGDSSYTKFCGAVDHLEDFVKENDGELLVQSLKLDGFFFDIKDAEKQIVAWTKGLVKKMK